MNQPSLTPHSHLTAPQENKTAPGRSSVEKLAEFVGELVRRRMTAGLSQGALGGLMGYDRTYVNKVERGAMEPTAEFARRADETLRLAGDLFIAWQHFDRARSQDQPERARPPHRPSNTEELPADLLVDHDEASLTWTPETVRLHMQKLLVNVGEVPVMRYFIRIAVDRFPDDPARSNELYRRNPLTMEEVALEARCADEPMLWETAQDRDASKEIWLLFRNAERQFPLYPGERCAIDYTFSVGTEKWGDWFQRSVRLPTRRLSVHLEFPADTRPNVWGLETSPTAGQRPFATPIECERADEATKFSWSTPRPPVAARYRLAWKLHVPEHAKES